MRKLLLACTAALSSLVQAQEPPGRVMLEGGIVGGNSVACPGRYVGISGQVAGPVSLYGMVENYRCVDLAGSANRFGMSVLLGRSKWLVRPALRWGVEHDDGSISQTSEASSGASLTLGRRYRARFILHVGNFSRSPPMVLLQMGGYFSF
ncbi:MAG: hypothetical protein OXN97_10175 [Bryobacterales bacterium]|nr:hypothetical protein [Bryobacterales bacterium]